MSQSTEELSTAVQGVIEQLAEVGGTAAQVGGRAGELSQEAAGHGWHGMAMRMHDVAEALEVVAGQVGAGEESCGRAVVELGLIGPIIPAQEVVDHLLAGSSELGVGVSAVQGAAAEADRARVAAEEIGQEGVQAASQELHERLVELGRQLGECQAAGEAEHAAAVAYVVAQAGN